MCVYSRVGRVGGAEESRASIRAVLALVLALDD